MLVVINGPLGVGKTTVSFELIELFGKAVMLDGDFICRVHPFDVHDPSWLTYLHETTAHLIRHHTSHGIFNFVFNHVFEDPQWLDHLKAQVEELVGSTRCFRLQVTDEELIKRVRRRGRNNLDYELNRGVELNSLLETNDDSLGTPINTVGLSANQVAQELFAQLAVS